MRLTTRGRYAVTALLDLAMQSTDKVCLSDIAARQNLSTAYLEQLFSKMKKSGLVSSVRGAGGGYLLARQPSEIAVIDIISAVNESVDATQCDGQANCNHGAMCLTHDLWNDLSAHIEHYLSGITLACLMARKDVQPVTLQALKPSVPTDTSIPNAAITTVSA